MVFLWFSCFPIVFVWFSHGFHSVFLCFSDGLPMVSYGFRLVFLWCSCDVLMIPLWFPLQFLVLFLWFSYVSPTHFFCFSEVARIFLIPTWVSYDYPMCFLWVSLFFLWCLIISHDFQNSVCKPQNGLCLPIQGLTDDCHWWQPFLIWIFCTRAHICNRSAVKKTQSSRNGRNQKHDRHPVSMPRAPP